MNKETFSLLAIFGIFKVFGHMFGLLEKTFFIIFKLGEKGYKLHKEKQLKEKKLKEKETN